MTLVAARLQGVDEALADPARGSGEGDVHRCDTGARRLRLNRLGCPNSLERFLVASTRAGSCSRPSPSPSCFLGDDEASWANAPRCIAQRQELLRSGAATPTTPWLRTPSAPRCAAAQALGLTGSAWSSTAGVVAAAGGRRRRAGGRAGRVRDPGARRPRARTSPLLAVEAHAMGAGLAFDGVRTRCGRRPTAGSSARSTSGSPRCTTRSTATGAGRLRARLRLSATERRRLAAALDASRTGSASRPTGSNPTSEAPRGRSRAPTQSRTRRSASIAAKPIVSPRSLLAPVSRARRRTASATAGATSRLNTDGMM